VSNGTRLFQATRSPLIQGRSKTERPMWQAWLAGVFVAGVVLAAAIWARTTSRDAAFVFDAAMGWSLGGVAIGSAMGCGLSRTLGWRRRWIGASLVALVIGGAIHAVAG
jgi:apolipoprotein N-acyltransferase